MDLYVILRRSGWRSAEDLGEAAARSTQVGNEEMADDVRWIRSYVLDEGGGSVGTVCVYEATSPEAIRKHATLADLPVDEIIAVADTVLVRPDPAAGHRLTRRITGGPYQRPRRRPRGRRLTGADPGGHHHRRQRAEARVGAQLDGRIGLGGVHEPHLDDAVAQLRERHPPDVAAGLAAAPHRGAAPAAALDQAGVLDVADQAPPVVGVEAVALGDDGVVGLDHPLEALAALRAHARVGHRGGEVELFGEQPAAGLQRGDQARERRARVGQPGQEHARVHEVELARGQLVGEQVVGAHLEVRVRQAVEHRGVEVGRQHRAVGRDAVGQPPGDRAAAGADLQAPPPAADAARLELGDRPRVEERLQGPQPLALRRPRVVVRVLALEFPCHPTDGRQPRSTTR